MIRHLGWIAVCVALLTPGFLLAADSDPCEGFSRTRQDIKTFGDTLKSAVARGDHAAVVTMMHFPLRMNEAPGKSRWIKTKRTFLASYPAIITPAVAAAISNMNTSDVFCKASEDAAMLGDGVVWLRENNDAAIEIWVINRLDLIGTHP